MRRRLGTAFSRALPLVILASLFLTSGRAFAQVDLKQYVALIRTNFHQDTRNMFSQLGKHFKDQGATSLADFFNAYATAGAFGTGWIYVADNGENFIITNRHVVSEAATVDISFEQPDGSYRTYSGAPIVYVDDNMDLAVVEFPDRARVFKRGFPIDASFKPDGTELFSAGFPAFGGEPLWQFSTGIVTNSRARPVGFSGYDYLIQHSAQIDKGNSGGPLLVRSGASPTGYAVIGVNTWKANQRENTNFSIPAEVLPKFIERARTAVAVRSDPASMDSSLAESCRVLAAELNSPNPDLGQIHRFISYALVGRRGWEAFQTVLDTVSDKKSWEDDFFADPVETMRTSLFYLFSASLSKTAGAGSVEYVAVSAADRSKVARGNDVRTEYRIGGKTTEISWTWEYGRWRVLDFELPTFETAAAPKAQQAGGGNAQNLSFSGKPFSLLLLGLGLNVGDSNGYGAIYGYSEFPTSNGNSADKSVLSWSGGVTAQTNITDWFWLETQLNLVKKGRYYQWNSPADTDPTNNLWISESILYLQLPVMAKIIVVPTKGLSFSLAAGPALDFAVSASGQYWDWYDTQYPLPSTWYSNFLNRISVSAVAEIGAYWGLGGSMLGLVGRVDYDLTANFDYGVSDSSRFFTYSGGLRWVFPLELKAR